MRNFDFFNKIDDYCPLAQRLNSIMGDMLLLRMVSAPVTFSSAKDETAEHIYYLSCLFERWSASVVLRLKLWDSTIDKYFGEYECNWRYYAAAKRLECLRDGFGEEEDYDENGEPIVEGVSDDQLAEFSIVGDLYFEDWRDIVQETVPSDLEWVKSSMRISAENDFADVFKMATGQDVKTYMAVDDDEDGAVKMVPLSKDDRDLRKISKLVDAEDDWKFLFNLCSAMNNICESIKGMERRANNKETLLQIQKVSKEILSLKSY